MPTIDEFLDDLSAKGTSEETQAKATSWSEAFDLFTRGECSAIQYSW